jgi:cysteine-rich repeat protein
MVQVVFFLGLLLGFLADSPIARAAVCGDGIVDVSEGCDDGNLVDGDCCSSTCTPELCEAEPYDRLTENELEQFSEGAEEFEEEDGVAEGLGPVFNGASCAECHNVPTVGGSSPRVETRFGRYVGPTFDPMSSYGGSLIQEHGIDTGSCTVPGETVPPEATVSAGRQTQSLFGLGLIDAIAEDRILRRADPLDQNGDGISGRPNMIDGRVGRFGWKAQVASLHDFAGNAYLNEMGITNPDFPLELNPQGGPVVCDDVPDPEDPSGSAVGAFTDFMTMLAPLPTGERTPEVRRGGRLFRRLRCHGCHVRRLRTARNPIRALSLRSVHLFSDLLLHDLGPALGDGIEQDDATGSEFRTAPLWGVRASAPYLHDGRAATLSDAIAAHGGEAQASRDAFLALTVTERSWVVAFLNSL